LSVESVSHLMFSYADLFDHTDSWQHEHEAWNYNPVTMGTTAHDEATYMVEWYEANHKELSALLTPYQTDGIRNIEHSPLNIDHSVYDLHGRRIANGQWSIVNGQFPKGIYINGHKKILIK